MNQPNGELIIYQTSDGNNKIDVDVVQVERDRLEKELVEARLQMAKKLKEIQ